MSPNIKASPNFEIELEFVSSASVVVIHRTSELTAEGPIFVKCPIQVFCGSHNSIKEQRQLFKQPRRQVFQ